MKKILFYLSIVGALGVAASCADESLDPILIKEQRKGTILALRGTQLDNIYNKGLPGAELFPKIANGSETFAFEAEYLSGDPSSLESFDIFVIKRVGTARERVLVRNVPFSSFETGKYKNPSAAVSLSLKDEILPNLGLANTFPLPPATVNTLLSTYAFGVAFELDLNLKDGTKVLASELVAAGLFSSNQFYPAQRLTYAMTDYCAYNASLWAGTYAASEARSTVYGPYDLVLTQDGSNPNRFNITNFYDCGDNSRYIVFSVSSNPATQVVSFPSQTTATGTVSGTGTYNQCLRTLSINVTYNYTAASCNGSTGTDVFRYDFVRK